MGDRYFMAAAMAGRLYPHGIRERHSWDIRQLHFRDEVTVDRLLSPPTVDKKHAPPDELVAILEKSEKHGLPAITVWIDEDLVEVVRELWEHARR